METETSTVAAALTVKPSVNPKIVIGVVAAAVVAGAVTGVALRWKKSRSEKTADELNEA